MTPETRIELAGVGPVACIAMAWRDRAGQRGDQGNLRITLVVKATFALVPDGVAALRGGAPIIPVDRHYEGSARRSVEAPGDLAPRKKRADIVVTGHAHAPGGVAAPASSVRLGLFRDGVLLDKTLHVYGDRTRALPTPEPFVRVPLVYERAFGGPSSQENPVGVGLDGTAALPNIIDPREPTRRAGFGPIASSWPLRTSMLSADDQRALSAPIPEIRADFPWAYFQHAPPDQQTELLGGDEGILLDGLHPSMPRVQTRLPGVRARARVHRRQGSSWDGGLPLSLVCDTCAVDADHLLARLTFRGDFEALVEAERLGDVRIVAGIEIGGVPVGRSVDPVESHPGSEAPVSVRGPVSVGGPVSSHGVASGPVSARGGEEPLPVSTRGAVPKGKTMDGGAFGALAGATPPTPFKRVAPGSVSIASVPDSRPKPRAPDKGSTLPVESDLGERLARALATPFDKKPIAASSQVDAPRPVTEEGPPRAATALISPAQAEALERALATPWGDPARAATDAPRGSTAGLPFAREPGSPPSVREPAPVMAPPVMASPVMASPVMASPVMASPGMASPVMAPPVMASPVMASPVMASPVMAPPVMPSPAMASPASPAMVSPVMAPRAASSSPESVASTPVEETGLRAEVLERIASGKSLAGLGLAKEDLSDLDLSGANLAGMDLRGSRLDRARLRGADLTGANLTGARGEGAALERARCDRASFARGRWEGAIFDEASLVEADLSSATLAKASFFRADLTDAKLGDARAPEATFDGAKLSRARAEGATFTGASFVEVEAAEIVLDRASLADARLRGAKLDRAGLSGASCERASFAGAGLEGARLARATLDGADLSGATLDDADLRQARAVKARFDSARMRRVQASRADFTEARLGAADLSGAVLRPARLTRADLGRATLDGADLRDADLTGATLTGASRQGTKLAGAKTGDVVD
jgi:uncharacterized protein YjbI with pentapeptide repeats